MPLRGSLSFFPEGGFEPPRKPMRLLPKKASGHSRWSGFTSTGGYFGHGGSGGKTGFGRRAELCSGDQRGTFFGGMTRGRQDFACFLRPKVGVDGGIGVPGL